MLNIHVQSDYDVVLSAGNAVLGGAGGDGGDGNGNTANGGDFNSGDFSGNGGIAVGDNGNGGNGGDAIGGESGHLTLFPGLQQNQYRIFPAAALLCCYALLPSHCHALLPSCCHACFSGVHCYTCCHALLAMINQFGMPC